MKRIINYIKFFFEYVAMWFIVKVPIYVKLTIITKWER